MTNHEKFVHLDTSKLGGAPGDLKVAPENAVEVFPTGSLEDRVVAALKTCYDPELPVNIYELGLIYALEIEPSGAVLIRMTLTSPGCPVAGSLVQDVQSKVQGVPGVQSARVELVWDPPWDRSRMSEAALLQLGLF